MAKKRKWVYARGNKLWCRLKDAEGKWISRSTGYSVGEERAAIAYAKKAQAILDSRRSSEDMPAEVSVESYAEQWIIRRRESEVATWKQEASRLRLHALPYLGELQLTEVTPMHVRDWILKLKRRKNDKGERLAPRSVRHVFATLKRMFKSALIEQRIASNPVEVEKGVLPKSVDKDPGWRIDAVFTRLELAQLITDERIPADRRTFYALMGLAGLRSGEAASLRWCDVESDARPLGRIRANDTKTRSVREVPIHPELGALLAQWRRAWLAAYGRQPKSNDLIVPVVAARASKRRPKGALVSRHFENSKHREADLNAIGMRQRRGHDLRRTFISLALADGASPNILRRVTHAADKADMMDVYSSFTWARRCDAVAMLQLDLATVSLQSKTGARNVSDLEPMTRLELVTYGLRNAESEHSSRKNPPSSRVAYGAPNPREPSRSRAVANSLQRLERAIRDGDRETALELVGELCAVLQAP